MIEKFKLIDRKQIDSNKVFDYCKDTLELPDGHRVEYATLLHKGAAAIVPVLPDGRILQRAPHCCPVRRPEFPV